MLDFATNYEQDTKLKKEENLELLKKLASQKVDTSLFQSSKKLGRGADTKREALRRALAESRAGIDVAKNEGLLLVKHQVREIEDNSSDEESKRPKNTASRADLAKASSKPAHANGTLREPCPSRSSSSEPDTPGPATQLAAPQQTNGIFGTGLKRPLEVDESGRPVIQVRKRRKGQSKKPVVVEEEVPWEGFSSSEQNSDLENIEGSEHSSAESEGADAESEEEDMSDAGSEVSEEDSDSEDDSDEESDTSPDEDNKIAKKERTSAFKAWATQQRNEQVGFTPTNQLSYAPTPANFKPRAPEQDPLPPELETNTATDATRKAFSVVVERSHEVQQSRMQLPIVAEEQKIMEAIHNHDVVVVWGATGSGKTTQVPQFLLESGYGAADGPTPGMIGVTQPRRVAAVSMAKRVGDELGDQNAKVAYQIRFDTSTSAKTAVKFMTDGVLLREITQDFILTKYSAIVIDEAH